MLHDFLVCEFAKETLGLLVRERFGSEFPDIIQKNQIDYLYNYLSNLGCKSILMESDYVDRDYLEDYSRYYVKCFTRYGERCARLHFFRSEIDHKSFSETLDNYSGRTRKELNDAYLGFIVIKPLPKTFIGKSCFKIYSSITTNDKKKVLSRKYKISLFGIPLELDTVAFQEQDKVVSACATTAIWTALQALDKMDSRQVPSCSEITLSAINHVNDSSNSFPNLGLSNKQILRALDIYGFKNHKINIDAKDSDGKATFISIVQSYIRSDLPIIMGTEVYDIEEDKVIKRDGHAVTILGFDDSNAIYVHDDRVGPFAKATLYDVALLPQSIKFDGEDLNGATWCVALRNKNSNGDWVAESQILVPDSLVIPSYKKVRVASDAVENTCKALIEEYEEYYKHYEVVPPAITYDLSLQSLADIKNRIIKDRRVINKREILLSSAARFMWVAVFRDNQDKEPLFELLFDSTDIPQGNCYTGCIRYDDGYFDRIVKDPLNIHIDDTQILESNHHFLSSIAKSLKDKKVNFYNYLDLKYGEPRAPKRINEEEVTNYKLNGQSADIYFGRSEENLPDKYKDLISNDAQHKIWVITIDGALIIGDESGNLGHPTLTDFKPARIAGELRYKDGYWEINAKSGRYSSNYGERANEYLDNARQRFLEIFPSSPSEELKAKHYFESTGN
ncbi:hypothetical protein [Marinomonas sp.]|jgi:hypothetical protein|uniref:hypothetical protein n=1 Tax=Marinomonas sp. TaxID=1904862 RepID=UPI003A95BC9D